MGGALDVFFVFLRLGLSAFGGPIAHLGYFRRTFVERLNWLDEESYADLVALCQFLPGPTSSQVGFAIGLKRAGAVGGLAAWLGFTAPSAALMIAAGYGVFGAPDPHLIHALKIVALAVVAHAVVGMARGLLKGPLHWALALTAFAVPLFGSAPALAPLMIVLAGAGGAATLRAPIDERRVRTPEGRAQPSWASVMLLGMGGVITVFAVVGSLPNSLVQQLISMACTGALVFGGGHAVLPLMEADAVGRGWISADMFLAGYGFAQALPGPLFSFAAFIGAASGQGVGGAILVMAALFLPGLVLTALALPVWARLKSWPPAGGFVAGASAGVVGVLAAALYDPIFVSAVQSIGDLALAAAGFAALQWLKAPSWAVVLGLCVAGVALSLLGLIG